MVSKAVVKTKRQRHDSFHELIALMRWWRMCL